MNNVLVIFDDTVDKSEVIHDVIGNKGFADVVVKKKRLEEYYRNIINEIFSEIIWKTIHSAFEFKQLLQSLDIQLFDDIRVLHIFSNYMISDVKKAKLTFEKLNYIESNYKMISEGKLCGIMFASLYAYTDFLKIVCKENITEAIRSYDHEMKIEGLVDIGLVENFIQCITGNFDSRYFNFLKGDEYTLVKSSSNKKKIKSEYTYYQLLPDDMKYWYVMPFDYQEDENTASYKMERLHMTDLSIKWVHGSMDENEFISLMNKYFYFFKSRHKRKATYEEYFQCLDELYHVKVRNRIESIKQLSEYNKIARMLAAGGGKETTIECIFEKYMELKDKIERKNHFLLHMVIGHGDSCFANTLYNKSTKTLKFIDPRGALCEAQLWTNPYYDVAKLSHSVCGNYDFFNHALYEIKVNERLEYELHIPFDNEKYVAIFKNICEENGFDYWTVRLYEASLFLSMLPFHIDNIHKVFGFILNVKNILKEIAENV